MKLLIFAFIIIISLPDCAEIKSIPLVETIRFSNMGITLEGVLHLPEPSGKYPLAIFIHGSGMTTRNDYEEFVTPLLEEGIGVFRYDKRGVGASEGEYKEVGPSNSEQWFSLLASDAASAIQHFKNDKRIASNKIILIGGSQAGWIIPEINNIANVWLSVCISGPAVSVGEEIFYSELAEKGLYTQEHADKMLKDFKGIHGYSPISNIKKMKSPSLWIFGGKDVSIPIKKNLQVLNSIKTVNQLLLEIKLYPNADHGIYNATNQKHEAYIKAIIQWIKQQH